MTNHDAKRLCDELDIKKNALADTSGYSRSTVYNLLRKEEEVALTEKMRIKFEAAFQKRREEINQLPNSTKDVWDSLPFNGKDVENIIEGMKIGGYSDPKKLYLDAIRSYTDELKKQEDGDKKTTADYTQLAKKQTEDLRVAEESEKIIKPHLDDEDERNADGGENNTATGSK